MIANVHGIKIIDTFDTPEIFIAVSSSDFLIFKKNQTQDIKTTKGKKLVSKLGTYKKVNIRGSLKLTSTSLKKFISSNKFIRQPKQKNIKLALNIILINSIARYLFIIKDLVMLFKINFHI